MCGEKPLLGLPCLAIRGSPPHVRGKVSFGIAGQIQHGITPACAGKSSGAPDRLTLTQDHPRMCGEKPH